MVSSRRPAPAQRPATRKSPAPVAARPRARRPAASPEAAPGPAPAPRAPSRPAQDDLSAQVLRQFRQVFNAVRTHFQQVERRAGIGGAQVWALATVRDRPGIGVGELAQAMDIHQSTASNLVRGLVERDLLETRREWADRRSVQLHIRPAGARVLASAPQPFAGVLPDALGRLDPARLRRLHRDLEHLIQLVGADAEAGQVPLALEPAPRRRRSAA